MALQLTLPTEYGIDASYWKIISIFAGFDEKIAVAEVRGWQSKADMEAGLTPIGVRAFVRGPESIDFSDESQPVVTRAIMYAFIKQPTVDMEGNTHSSEFADAVYVE